MHINLTPSEAAVAIMHGGLLHQKILDHREKVGTYVTSGNQSSDHLGRVCVAGMLGEYAFRKAVGVPIPKQIKIGLDYFDGGRDVCWGNLDVQVKSALPRATYTRNNPPWLLSPAANPIRRGCCHLLALTIPWTPEQVEILGILTVEAFLEAARPFPHDPTAKGIPARMWPLERAIENIPGLEALCLAVTN